MTPTSHTYVWGFNSMTCDKFLKDECGGNCNDFKDKEDCEEVCLGKKRAIAKKEKEKGDCNKVLELSKLFQRSILYSSLFQISASEVSHLLKAFHNPCFGNLVVYQLRQDRYVPIGQWPCAS